MTQSRKTLVWILLIAAGLVAWTFVSRSSNLVGRSPRSLASAGTWINSESALDWDQLKGDVVWLEFSFLH